MSYVGACPRARSDLTRPAVPAEVCEARIQGALSCANDVLNRQTFLDMSPRVILKVPTYHTPQCAHAHTCRLDVGMDRGLVLHASKERM